MFRFLFQPTVSYGATLEAFHNASREASFVELLMERDVVNLEVGDKVEEEEEDDDTDDDS